MLIAQIHGNDFPNINIQTIDKQMNHILNNLFLIITIQILCINFGYSQNQNEHQLNSNEHNNTHLPFFVFITHSNGCVGCCAASINYLSDQIIKKYPDFKINLIIFSSLKGEGMSKKKFFNKNINVTEAMPDSLMESKVMPILLMSYKNSDFLFENLQSGLITIDTIEAIVDNLNSKISITSIQPISEDFLIISNASSLSVAGNGEIYGVDDESNSIFKISNSSFSSIHVPHDTLLINNIYDASNPDDINVWGNLIKYYPSIVSYRNVFKDRDTTIVLVNMLNGYDKYENQEDRPPNYVMKKSFYLLKIYDNNYKLIKFPNNEILYGQIRRNSITQKYCIAQYSESKNDSNYAFMVFDVQNEKFSYLCNYQKLINQKINNLHALKQSYMIWSNDTILFIDYANKLFGSIYSNQLNRICDSTFLIFQKPDNLIDFILYRNKALAIYSDVRNNKNIIIYDEYNLKGQFIHSNEIEIPFTEKILRTQVVVQEHLNKLFFLIKLEKSRWQLISLD